MKENNQNNSEDIDYKHINSMGFRKYVYELILQSNLSKEEKEEKKDKVQSLITKYGQSKFYGRMLFFVLKEVNKDLDKACEELFYDYKFTGLKTQQEMSSKYASFISGVSLTDADIALAIGASASRVSRVRNGTSETDLYAFQVYALAIITKVKPSQLFNYFYGDGERPIVGLVPDGEVKGGSGSEGE